jgi:hypothetical protein
MRLRSLKLSASRPDKLGVGLWCIRGELRAGGFGRRCGHAYEPVALSGTRRAAGWFRLVTNGR